MVIENVGMRLRRGLRSNAYRYQDGVVFPLLMLVMTGLLAATAVGVGFGRMTLAASEAQSAADVAAIAGAFAVFKDQDPHLDALFVLSGNEVDMRSPVSMLSELTVGTYSFENGTFITGGFRDNAVRARVTTAITNPFGALIQKGNQTVEKVAYAALTGLRGARPTLPIVVGECHFEDDCQNNQCMPRLTQAPANTDNSGWTAFFDVASNSKISEYMPAECGGTKVQEVWIGDIINVQNGQTTPLLRDVECAIDHGIVEHIIPIVPCGGQYNQSKEIVGFATIVLEYVKVNGGNKGIDLHAIFKSDAIGATGGRLFGTGNIILVPLS